MKKLFLQAFATLLYLAGFAQQKTADITIIPEPLLVSPMPGSFVLNQNTQIHYEGKAGRITANLLNDFLESNYNFKLELNSRPLPKQPAYPIISIVEASTGKPEGYILEVNAGKVYLQGDAAGLFYGLQTIRQLVPVDKKAAIHIPALRIQDYPRFAYRGLMLDAGRHFFPPSYIRQFIDMMALYKFNRFHWHLTDDQGWRIEIKKYPRLQEIASVRKETLIGHHRFSKQYDGKPYGGYYTQEEVRNIVQYAAERNITIIPEIEMPGHSQAVLAAYPRFGNTGGPYEVRTTWGISKDVLNPANDSVFTFLQDVLTEVMDLFPGKYIHIGGDECLKDRWKESAEVQQLIRKLGLKNEHDLQSYFIQRMEKFVNSKGRAIIGWDEILEGGLAPNATVMSWRGEEGGIAAAKQKHDVIMTPNTYLYLDYYQGHTTTEPLNAGNFLPLKTVYKYEPLPASLDAAEKQYIKGVQANIWTEFMPDQEMVNYMTWPRALAVSEIAWSQPGKKDLSRFMKKLPSELARMNNAGIRFRIPEPVGLESKLVNTTEVTVTLTPPVKGAAIFYTTDGSEPGTSSSRYIHSIHLPVPEKGTATLRTIVVLPSGRISPVYSAGYIRDGNYLPAQQVKPGKKGLTFTARFGESTTTDTSGIIPQVDIRQLQLKNWQLSAVYEGYVKLDADGLYEWYLNADDQAKFYLDDQLLLDISTPGTPEKNILSVMRKGYHKVKVEFRNTQGGPWLELGLFRNGEKINLADHLYTGQ
ncbi:family 20 glycosylhydrolase [Chitinophaga tropicalis]|uniref:beta-N-acetylhexosaminidase n=1 Tax=Chitinophaga tropicalis TaxID=2683588 RepID=A0A7K1U743_9BACT|nr:family 20 glycosylhydrolase [Chitinophaga tropicalis]MVT10181.1 family 20 glycosylhydrolase [Chitinophaga tropicalis]